MAEAGIGSSIKNAILAIAVIFIVAALAIIAFNNYIFPIFMGENLGMEQEQHFKDNFDTLIGNIEKCRSYQDNDCLCEGFPNYPGTFPTNSEIDIEEINRNTYLKWIYKNKEYKNATLENIKLSVLLFPEKKEYYARSKNIYYKEEPPEIRQDGLTKKYWHGAFGAIKPRLISDKLYKDENVIYFIASYNYKDNEIEQINNLLNSIKKCEDNQE